MICKRCGKKADRGWRFCPNCGSGMEQRSRSIFDDIFSRFRREFREMDRAFDKDFEVLDLSPFSRKPRPERAAGPRRTGFTIKITRRNNEKPHVDVKTFGNVNGSVVRKELADEMRGLGMGTALRSPPEASGGEGAFRDKPSRTPSPAKFMEEPKTRVSTSGNGVSVEMELPDVGSEDDIEINQLESSVEVRARAGDKAYFKIITKPEGLSITKKSFESGKLRLEFS